MINAGSIMLLCSKLNFTKLPPARDCMSQVDAARGPESGAKTGNRKNLGKGRYEREG